VYDVSFVEKALLVVEFHKVQALRSAKPSSAMRAVLASQQQQLLKRCFKMLLK
jgi:hypothetical protein